MALNKLNLKIFKVNDEQISLGNESVSYDTLNHLIKILEIIFLDYLIFCKKKTYTQMFVKNLHSQDDESPYWLYCNETSAKLLPKFILLVNF